MDFSKIVLDKADYKRLKRCRRRPAPGNRHGPLCRLGLAYEARCQPVRGNMPVGTGKISITDEGRLYLNWRKQDVRRYRLPQWISIVALIVSIIALIRTW